MTDEMPHVCPTPICIPCAARHLAQIQAGVEAAYGDRLDELDAELAALADVNADPVYANIEGVDFTPTDWDADDTGVEWLCDQFLGEDMRTLLVSAAGVGKTWFGLAIALAVSTNLPFAGHGVNNQRLRPVIILDEENPASVVRSRVRSLSRGMGLSTKDYRGRLLHYSQKAFHRKQESRQALQEWMTEVNPCLLVFDTARRFLEGDENDSGAVSEMWAWVDDLRTTTSDHAAALILHHSGHEAARARGSSDWLASPDIILQLAGDMGTQLKVSWSKLREGEAPNAETLRFKRKGSAMSVENDWF